MSKMKDLIIDPIDLQSMSIEDLKLLKLRLVGKALTKFPSSPRQFKVRAEIDKVWNELNRRRGLDNNMTKENEDSQRSKSVLRKSSRIIRLPGDNSRDAEAPKPWSKAESLMRLLTERLPSGFSIENWNLEISDEMFTFAVSIPSSASKSIIPPEGNTVYIGGSGTFEAYFDREEGWDISVDFNEKSLVFLDENDKEVKIDSKQIRGVIKQITMPGKTLITYASSMSCRASGASINSTAIAVSNPLFNLIPRKSRTRLAHQVGLSTS